MKKIIITIMALALGASAMAKDIKQLTAEFSALKDKASRVAYVQENIGDIEKAYPVWVENGRRTIERRVFTVAYHYSNIFSKCTDYELAFISARKLCKDKLATNPNWYEYVKADGYKLNGNKLVDCQIYALAESARDSETMETIIARNNVDLIIGENFKSAVKVLLQMKNAEMAKEKLTALQTAIATRNPQDARLDTIKTYLRIVREKCLDAKLK